MWCYIVAYEIDLSMIDWVVIELRKIVSTKIPTLLLRSTLLINDTIIKCGTFLQNFFFSDNNVQKNKLQLCKYNFKWCVW